MATIKDLSKKSGVGVGTISRYLNGYKVKEKTRVAIELALQDTGYVRNPIARSMKTGKSMMVAVVVPNLANMFSMRVIESIERVLEKEGYSVIVSDCGGDEERQLQKLKVLKHKMVDGFILMPLVRESEKIVSILGSIPVVLIDRLTDKPIFDSVTVSNFETSYNETKRLLQSGVRKIGIIEGPQNIYTAVERKRGFETALREFGIANEYVAKGGYNVEDGYKAMNKLLKYNLEGIFISNYELTIGAMRAYAESDQSIKIVGFDSIELSHLINKSIICISQPVEEIGEKAADLLLERMNNPNKQVKNIVIRI